MNLADIEQYLTNALGITIKFIRFNDLTKMIAWYKVKAAGREAIIGEHQLNDLISLERFLRMRLCI
jgi:hypothetical protein